MKSIYSFRMEQISENELNEIPLKKKNSAKSKLSLMEFAFSTNFNLLNPLNQTDLKSQISPLKSKRLNSMKLNVIDNNEFRDNSVLKLNNQNSFNNNIINYHKNNYNSINSYDQDKDLIRSKIRNQSELNISLKTLRGKSFRKCEIKSIHQSSPNKGLESKSNLSNTAEIANNKTEKGFAKFFKKPLTFRVSEFEEKNLIEKDDKNKQNKTYAQQRFFAHAASGNNNINTKLTNKNNISPINTNYSKASKNSYLDDIEKVKLINNEEELVKKYVLPEIKYLTTNERNKLFNYDVNDNREKFVIKKSNGIFLSDLLKNEENSTRGVSPINAKSNEKQNKFRKTKINVNETKFGIFPKFLMKSSGFVKFGGNSAGKKIDLDNQNVRNYSSKKLDFNQTVKADSDVNNFNQTKNNNINDNNNNDSNEVYRSKNHSKTGMLKNNKIYFENYNWNNEEKIKLVNKTSSSAFNFNNVTNISNFINTVDIDNNNENANLSPFYSNYSHNTFQYNKIKSSNNHFISRNGYEINRDKYFIANNRKHNRKIILDYPPIKFPIKPYKKLKVSKQENPNYLTNGSIVNDSRIIKDIKLANEKIAKNFKNDKGNVVTNEMSENLIKLEKIEKKIADLIEVSRIKMKDKDEYKKFESNTSLVLIK